MKVTIESIPSAEFGVVVRRYLDIRKYEKNDAGEHILRVDGGFMTLSAKAWRVIEG